MQMPESRYPNLDQLEKALLRGKLDSVTRISELMETLRPLLKALSHSGITITLPADAWKDRAQKIQNDEFLLAKGTYWYFVCGDADNFAAWSEACVTADNITKNGEMTFHCLATPTVDLTVHILRLEVEL